MIDLENQKIIRDFVQNAFWYHTIEFVGGLVSNGLYDHRPRLSYYGLPDDFKNRTVLDVGAADGFFSFELEKRGAKVTAIDTHAYDGEVGHSDISPSKRENYKEKYNSHKIEAEQFQEVCKLCGIDTLNRLSVAKVLLNSSVNFRYESIYNLRNWNEKFDLVICGDLIEHLKDPLGALENLISVTREKCIITLSSTLKAPKNYLLPAIIIKALNKILTKVGLRLIFRSESKLLEYYGNVSGGSFFHFYPETFRQAALASGFSRVEIFSQFDVKSKVRDRSNFHVVFHCYV